MWINLNIYNLKNNMKWLIKTIRKIKLIKSIKNILITKLKLFSCFKISILYSKNFKLNPSIISVIESINSI